MKLERDLIRTFRHAGLTNIVSGNVHPLESQIARINANLDRFRPFCEWDLVAPDYARSFALKRHGSMRAFYDWIRERFTELRDEYEAKLQEERGHG